MRNDEKSDYKTFSEMKEEFPKPAKDFNWSAKMFYYLTQAGLLKRQYDYKIKSHVYSRQSLIKILRSVNDNLDDLRINL